MKYSQPDFYHFSEDSIFLSNFVAKELDAFNKKEALNLIDLCAGCGVVGIEVVLKAKKEIALTSCEYQVEFEKHLKINSNKFISNKEVEIVMADIVDLNTGKYNNCFDVVVCNPPYYNLGTGRLPADKNKSLCHFWPNHLNEELFRIISLLIKKSHLVFLLARSDNMIEVASKYDLQVIKSIRHGRSNILLFGTL